MTQNLPITEVSVITTAASPIDRQTSLSVTTLIALTKLDRSCALVFMQPTLGFCTGLLLDEDF
jgi:hypothetical protein